MLMLKCLPFLLACLPSSLNFKPRGDAWDCEMALMDIQTDTHYICMEIRKCLYYIFINIGICVLYTERERESQRENDINLQQKRKKENKIELQHYREIKETHTHHSVQTHYDQPNTNPTQVPQLFLQFKQQTTPEPQVPTVAKQPNHPNCQVTETNKQFGRLTCITMFNYTFRKFNGAFRLKPSTKEPNPQTPARPGSRTRNNVAYDTQWDSETTVGTF